MPKRQNEPTRLHRTLTGASAGCTAFLIGMLVLGTALVALSLRG